MADLMNRTTVIGGGPVGMALALALYQHGVDVSVLEARPRDEIRRDPRVLALSYGSQQILQQLGVWADLRATPINTIHVSRRGEFGRALMRASDLAVPALGYVLPAAELIGVFDAALRQSGITYRDRTKISSADEITGVVPDNALTVWAEGSIASGSGQFHDYRQTAILCSVTTQKAHENLAWERFTADGPLALLPLGKDYAVVLTAASTDAPVVAALDDSRFLALLQSRFGQRHRFLAISPRVSYPLTLRWREDTVAERQVWLGNAAQTLHPVAGQGFNLALRDVWELTRQLSTENGKRDPGAPAVLQAYAAARATDRRSVIGFTNGLIEVFGSELAPLAHARGAGLMALDLMPPLRDFLARRMMFGARGW